MISKEAKKIIHSASAGAAVVCASPIPFSDSAMLLPVQATMITKLYKMNGKRLTDGMIKGVLTSMTVSLVGKGLAGNLVKFIPGIGTVTGGMINASVAVLLTQMIGRSVADALEKGEIDNTDDLVHVLSKTVKWFPAK